MFFILQYPVVLKYRKTNTTYLYKLNGNFLINFFALTIRISDFFNVEIFIFVPVTISSPLGSGLLCGSAKLMHNCSSNCTW